MRKNLPVVRRYRCMLAARKAQAPMDYVSLAAHLTAIGYPARLRLLDLLRFPQTLSDIDLPPYRGARHRAPKAARETIRAHVQKLVEVGLVKVERLDAAGKQVNLYSVNPLAMYALLEGLRRVSTVYGDPSSASEATGTLAGSARVRVARGPRLVLVHGLHEGKVFPLTSDARGGGAWRIGRGPGLAVRLDYDPYVSADHADVTRRNGRYYLTDLEGSKNGTALNWEPLEKGRSKRLHSGDVIGVGGSLLCARLG